ncbi:hypothetical protein EC973_001585 [Apophysomyces ossiformis]|uniref:Uncharacterized protein n=1 Tax=Apophysomyces ossiformis TaxID=679940 RepID=A0A8H7BPR0_9FUNG|nr:hypothetical protein EC973_001585 [Apophysomyces ossiformis]
MHQQPEVHPQSHLMVAESVDAQIFRAMPIAPYENTVSLPCLSRTDSLVHPYLAQQPLPTLPNGVDPQPTIVLPIPDIADFASSMVHLLWHGHRASTMAGLCGDPNDRDSACGRETATTPSATSTAFRKLTEQVLYATQLSESVVLLSLKYIDMLLQKYPKVHGAQGSEFRLFTVALMLANKFLDDNTFTNKTWSAISGMNVQELSKMELEFLDVLQFQLYVRKEEFDHWHIAQYKFSHQLQAANRASEEEKLQVLEKTLKHVGLSILRPAPWLTEPQQQHYDHYLCLLCQTQRPYFPPDLPNQPFVRVPLRIPSHPLYQSTYASHMAVQAPDVFTQTNALPMRNPAEPSSLSIADYTRPVPTNFNRQAQQPSSNIAMSKSIFGHQGAALPSAKDIQLLSQHCSMRNKQHVSPFTISQGQQPMYEAYGAQRTNDATFYQQQPMGYTDAFSGSTGIEPSNNSLSYKCIAHRRPSLDVSQIAGSINLTSRGQTSQGSDSYGNPVAARTLFHYSPARSMHVETNNGYCGHSIPYPRQGSSYDQGTTLGHVDYNGHARPVDTTTCYDLPSGFFPIDRPQSQITLYPSLSSAAGIYEPIPFEYNGGDPMTTGESYRVKPR